jgi:hypothetical protein
MIDVWQCRLPFAKHQNGPTAFREFRNGKRIPTDQVCSDLRGVIHALKPNHFWRRTEAIREVNEIRIGTHDRKVALSRVLPYKSIRSFAREAA